MITVKWKKRPTTRFIVIHDSHTPPHIEDIQGYLKFRGRQMGLLDVGYHCIIERTPRVVWTRDPELYGSAAPGLNHDAVHVCLEGGADVNGHSEDNITFDQKRLLITEVLPSLHAMWPEAQVVGHSERARSSKLGWRCPCWDPEEIRQDYAFYCSTGVIP